MTSRIVGTNNTWTNRIRCKSDVAHFVTSVIENRRTVTNCVYTWKWRFLFLINKESTIAEEFDLTISKSCIRTETNSQDNHIYIEGFFIGYKAFYLTISFNRLNSLSKCQTDVVVFQVFRHDVCEVFVIVAIQDSVHDIHQDNIFTKTFESFSKFNTDVTTTNYGDTIQVFAVIFQFFDHFFSVLVQFNELKIFKSCFEFAVTRNNFNSFNWRNDWCWSSRKD